MVPCDAARVFRACGIASARRALSTLKTHAELATDGHFIVYCSAPDYGQGTNTVMSQIAAEALGVSREHVEIINADTGAGTE